MSWHTSLSKRLQTLWQNNKDSKNKEYINNKNILLTQSWTHTALSKGHTTLRGKNATKVNFYCHVGKKILLIYRSRYLKADSRFFLFFFLLVFPLPPSFIMHSQINNSWVAQLKFQSHERLMDRCCLLLL